MSNTALLEEIKTETAQLKTAVREAEIRAEGFDSVKHEFTDRLDRIEEAQKEIRRQEVPKSPEFSNTYRLENKSLLNGAIPVSIKELIEMDPNNAIIRGTDAQGQIEKIHLYQDAVVIKYWHYKRKHDHGAAVQMLKRAPEYKVLKKLLSEAGYGTPESMDKSIEDSSMCLKDFNATTKGNEVPYTVGGSDTESALVFTLLSGTVIQLMHVQHVLMNYVRKLQLTRNSQKFPANLTNNYAVLGGQAGTEPPLTTEIPGSYSPAARMFQRSSWGTIQYDVKHCMGFMQWNDDMVEDSIIAFVPQMREELARSLVNARERALISGVEIGLASGVHRDYDVHTGTNNAVDYRRAHTGFRYMSLLNAINHAGVAITAAAIRAQRALMGKYGQKSADVVHLITMKQWYELLKYSDVVTMDKFGPKAVINTGQLGKLDNCDLVISDEMPANLTLNGYNETGGTNTFACAISFNKNEFTAAEFGGLNIESTRNAPLLHTILQADLRCDFQPQRALTSGQYGTGLDHYPVVQSRNVLD